MLLACVILLVVGTVSFCGGIFAVRRGRTGLMVFLHLMICASLLVGAAIIGPDSPFIPAMVCGCLGLLAGYVAMGITRARLIDR